jgi:hypothetical protein
MSQKRNGVNHSRTVMKNMRRLNALKRLEEQLQSGVKKTKEGETVDLSDKDSARITKEIGILKARI